jgi:tetratricopeptide (TPR) repeat protein
VSVARSAFRVPSPLTRVGRFVRTRRWKRGTRNTEGGTLLVVILLSGLPPSPLAAQVPAGDSAWAAGDYAAARLHYETGLQRNPGSVRALYRLGILLAWDGKLDSSLTLLQLAREVEPGEPDVRLQEATVLSWKGKYRASLSKWDSLLTEFPDRRDAAYGRARTLSWAGRMKQADSAYAALAASDPGDLDALAGRGQVAAWRGDYNAAARFYHEALARDPDHVPSLVGLAQVRLWQSRPNEAEQQITRALAVAPRDRAALDAQRAIRALRRPRIELGLGWSHDSDRNTLWWQSIGASLLVANGLRSFASAGIAEASDPIRNGTRLSAEVGTSLDRGNLGFTAALGARGLSSDAAPDRTLGTWRLSASYRFAPTARAGLGYSHYSFDETALLLGRDVDIDEISVDADAELRPDLSLGVGASTGWLSDNNQRRSAVIALTQRLARRFTVGLFGRALGYDQRGIGYFAPDRFLVGEARGSYTYGVRRWEARLSGGLGLQQVGKGATAQSEWHAEARALRRWSVINEVALSGGISNSAESSTTGAFRYYTAALSVRLGL